MVRTIFFDSSDHSEWWSEINGLKILDNDIFEELFMHSDEILNALEIKDLEYLFIIHTGEEYFNNNDNVDIYLKKWKQKWSALSNYTDRLCIIYVSGGSYLVSESDVPENCHFHLQLPRDNRADIVLKLKKIISLIESKAEQVTLRNEFNKTTNNTQHWLNQKSTFEHDLQNYLELIADTFPSHSKLNPLLQKWPKYQNTALSLTLSHKTEMSPRLLFKVEPLNRCDDSTKEWLGDLVEKLWIDRYTDNQALINEVTERLEIAVLGHKDLCKNNSRENLNRFVKSCNDLMGAIRKFPSKIEAFHLV